jgi:hypothetical protein
MVFFTGTHQEIQRNIPIQEHEANADFKERSDQRTQKSFTQVSRSRIVELVRESQGSFGRGLSRPQCYWSKSRNKEK